MDLWIRSQNRENLVKIKDIQISNKKLIANYEDYVEGENYILLGEYATKERALEILNDIHYNVLTTNFEEKGLDYERADLILKNIMVNNILKIYTMPEE